MKKVAKFFCSVLVVAALAASQVEVFAFTPSVVMSEVPEIDYSKTSVIDATGNLSTITENDAHIMSMNKIDSSTEEGKNLADAFEEIKLFSENNGEVTNFEKALDELLTSNKMSDKDGKQINANEMAVRDLFDVTISDDLKKVLDNGGSVTMNFKANLNKNDIVSVMHQNTITKEWIGLDSKEVKVNEDGSVNATFDSFCPITILVYNPEIASGAPVKAVEQILVNNENTTTSANNNIKPVVSVVVIVSMVILGTVFYSSKKKSKNS